MLLQFLSKYHEQFNVNKMFAGWCAEMTHFLGASEHLQSAADPLDSGMPSPQSQGTPQQLPARLSALCPSLL